MALPETPLSSLLHNCNGSAEKMVSELIKRNWLNNEETQRKEEVIANIKNIMQEHHQQAPMPGPTAIDLVARYIESMSNYSKQCPICNRCYSDEAMNFCLDDGTLLVAAYDPDATLVAQNYNADFATLKMPHIGAEVKMRDVLEHFLRTEITRPEYARRKAEITYWFSLSESKFIQKVRQFSLERNDVHPIFTWTIGTLENTFHMRVKHWIFAEIDLRNTYTCGINPTMKPDLDLAQGNLKRFIPFAKKYSEFQLNSIPREQDNYLLAIDKVESDKDGDIEIIDGAHRAIAMLANNVNQTYAFLGKLD